MLCPIEQDLWSSLAPKKCKIFAWLEHLQQLLKQGLISRAKEN
jgi:hypothetical protein